MKKPMITKNHFITIKDFILIIKYCRRVLLQAQFCVIIIV